MEIEPESVKSLFVEMFFNETPLSTGTCFIVRAPRCPVLITNRHNVTGRHQETGKTLSKNGGEPNKIRVWYNNRANLGMWHPIDYPLLDADGAGLWVEHPKMGASADFVAYPVQLNALSRESSYDLSPPSDPLVVRPADQINIIGFPFGIAGGGRFGVWVSGFIATEPDIDYGDKPVFLVDSRTRPGQSGSPVIAVRRGIVHRESGRYDLDGDAVEFLGIYSGRINEQADLGFVWKRACIKELVDSIV